MVASRRERAISPSRAMAILGIGCVLWSACAPVGGALVVSVVTDLEPGDDFVGVEVRVLRGDHELAHVETVAMEGPWVEPARVAEVHGLPLDTLTVRVVLLGPRRVPAGSREVVVQHTADRAMTVVFTSSCVGVVCPGVGDPATAVSCLGGQCVEPACADCVRQCVSGADCPASETCGAARCVEGLCIYPDGASECSTGEACHPSRGCVPTMMTAGCRTQADCPEPIMGTWTTCSFDDACDESGERMRDLVTFACMAGRCEPSTEILREACPRETDGMGCGDGGCMPWRDCEYEPCATDGMRYDQCSSSQCVEGRCDTTIDAVGYPCSRLPMDGATCDVSVTGGSCQGVCAGGSCGALCQSCGGACTLGGCRGGSC